MHTMLKTALPLAEWLLLRTRLHYCWAPFCTGCGLILMLHSVCPKAGRPRLPSVADQEITPESLEQLIIHLAARGYRSVSLDEAVALLRDGKRTEKFVVYTLDDGYADNYEQAYPVFRKHGVPFTVYVATAFPERIAVLWWYLLEDILLCRDRIVAELNGSRETLDCATLAAKDRVFMILRAVILAQSESNTDAIFRQLLPDEKLDVLKPAQQRALSWAQIELLSRDSLVTIGAHTVSHRSLGRLPEAEMRHEIIQSKQMLEAHVGRPIEHFSYPIGKSADAGPREFLAAQAAGFKTATTTRAGCLYPAHAQHPLCWPRIPIMGSREGCDARFLDLWLSGTSAFLRHPLKRVMID